MPASAIRFSPNKPAVKVLPIELPTPRQPVAIVALKSPALSPAAKLFINRARELGKRLNKRR
jgi:hypothetical protein